MVEEAALAEHQEIAEAADTVAERLDLVVHVIRRTGEAGTALEQLLDRRGPLVDRVAVAVAERIRSTRAPTKDRLIDKIMGGNPVFRGTRVPVHMLAELVPSRGRRQAVPAGTVG